MSCDMQDINSQPGIEPVPPAVEAQSPNHWTTREFSMCIIIIYLPAQISKKRKKIKRNIHTSNKKSDFCTHFNVCISMTSQNTNSGLTGFTFVSST